MSRGLDTMKLDDRIEKLELAVENALGRAHAAECMIAVLVATHADPTLALSAWRASRTHWLDLEARPRMSSECAASARSVLGFFEHMIETNVTARSSEGNA